MPRPAGRPRDQPPGDGLADQRHAAVRGDVRRLSGTPLRLEPSPNPNPNPNSNPHQVHPFVFPPEDYAPDLLGPAFARRPSLHHGPSLHSALLEALIPKDVAEHVRQASSAARAQHTRSTAPPGARGCNRMCSSLQPYVLRRAGACSTRSSSA